MLRESGIRPDCFVNDAGTDLGAAKEWLALIAVTQPEGKEQFDRAIRNNDFAFWTPESLISLNSVFNTNADGSPVTTMISGLNLIKLIAQKLGPIPPPPTAIMSVDDACEFWKETELGTQPSWNHCSLLHILASLYDRYLDGDLHEDNSPLECALSFWKTLVIWHKDIIPAEVQDPSSTIAWEYLNKTMSIVCGLHPTEFDALPFPPGDTVFDMSHKSKPLTTFWSKISRLRVSVRKGIKFACNTEDSESKEATQLATLTTALTSSMKAQQSTASAQVSHLLQHPTTAAIHPPRARANH
jgi:hypothetical protein